MVSPATKSPDKIFELVYFQPVVELHVSMDALRIQGQNQRQSISQMHCHLQLNSYHDQQVVSVSDLTEYRQCHESVLFE